MNKKIFFFIIIIFLLFIPIISKAESEDCRNRGKNDCSMGSICSSNADCKSGDCERSTKTDSDGNRIWFCDCGEVDGDWIPFVPETSRTCAQEYGGKAEDWLCKDGAAFSWDLDYCLDKKTPTNTKFPITTTETGFLDTIFDPTGAAVKSVDEIQSILKSPSTKINIPGLNFSEPKAGTDETGQTYVFIPFIGEYLKAIYKWLIAALGVFAIVRLMQAGFGWLMSGGSAEKITVEQKKIQNAIAGLALAVGSYVLLYTINPVLVEFRNLKVQYIKTEALPTFIEDGEFNTPEDYAKLTVNAGIPYNPQVTDNPIVTHMGQCDTRNDGWGNYSYGCGKTICESGCGLISTTMVLNSYLTTDLSPKETADWIVNNNYRSNSPPPTGATCSGTSWEGIRALSKNYGFESKLLYNLEKASEYAKLGKPIIIHVQNLYRERDANLSLKEKATKSSCKFTTRGHYIVITKYDPNTGIYSIDDPARTIPEDKRKQATADYLIKNCKASGFLYIYPDNTIPTTNTNNKKNPAAISNKCTFTESRWNKETGSSVVYRTAIDEPYDQVIASDPNYVSKIDSRCSICEQDQVTINIDGKSTKICWAYAEQVTQILNKAKSNNYSIKSLAGYRPLRSGGTIDENNFYTGVGGHFYGMAIDVNSIDNGLYNNCSSWNPIQNPKGPLPDSCQLSSSGGEWNPETKPNSSVYYGSPIYNAFTNAGWKWGGKDLENGTQRDFMDFSIYGYDFSTK